MNFLKERTWNIIAISKRLKDVKEQFDYIEKDEA